MLRSESPDRSRRRLLAVLAGTGVAALLGLRLRGAKAAPPPASAGGSAEKVPETDPLAQSLGYKEDAEKVDKAKFSNYKPGQRCETCRFYQGSAGSAFGPCQIFGGKQVSAKGWCSSYNLKA